MSVRVLTIDEMLAQPDDQAAVLVRESQSGWRSGITVFRSKNLLDDQVSAAYLVNGYLSFFTEGEIGVVEPQLTKEQLDRPAEELGVYRPDLNTRKVGKVRVELVDDGFPLALREVAKVMTWAQTAKGYKDHDWQNLPNAEQALSAAASRHRSDYIMQRMIGDLPASECVDPESDLIHKAHEAFGVLAQLELALRGKFEGRPAQL